MKLPKVVLRPGCERRDDRYMLADARIEWRDAEDGARRLQLLDISRRGLNFGLEPGAAQFPEGMEMSDVELHIGEQSIHGRLIVTQVVESTTRGATCGGEFHPGSPGDEEIYLALITWLESNAAFKTTQS